MMAAADRDIRFVQSHGVLAPPLCGSFPQPLPADFALNSPVGVVMDHLHNVWVCDVGNNRIVIFSAALDQIVGVITSPLDQIPAEDENDIHQLIMPFHVCPHPEQPWMYVTELGNQRILVFEYGANSLQQYQRYAHCVRAFDDEMVIDQISCANLDLLWEVGRDRVSGGTKKNSYNGITLIRDEALASGWCVYAADEFYQAPQHQDQEAGSANSLHIRLDRSRVVRFTDQGHYLSHFRGVQVADGSRKHNLLWPQGLCTDSVGNLYIANTGKDEIIKCDPKSPMDGDENLILANDAARTQFHTLQHETVNNYTTSMRSVSVLKDRVFISAANTITVYDRTNNTRGLILGEFSAVQGVVKPFDSLSEMAYQALGHVVLSCPYEICQGPEPDVYYLSEPFLSKVVKIRIELRHNPALIAQAQQVFHSQGLSMDHFDFITSARIIASVDSRRLRREEKFNVVSSIFAIEPQPAGRPPAPPATPLEFYLQAANQWLATGVNLFNQQWRQTQSLFGRGQKNRAARLDLSRRQLFAVDMGNWKFKSLQGSRFGRFRRLPVAGTMCVASWYPRSPLLGQICPEKPILVMTNNCFGVASMMQFDQRNRLIPYGLPFGWLQMRGPQGLAIDDDGLVFIADPVANRVWKWQIWQNGVVTLVNAFSAPELPPVDPALLRDDLRKPVEFLPTSVALDADHRLWVCDQGNSTIRVFDKSGYELAHFGHEGYWDGSHDEAFHFCLPTSVCIAGDKLIVNDLVNRALKVFSIRGSLREPVLQFEKGRQFFNLRPEHGGLWMPFFIHADQSHIYVPDCTFNNVNVYSY